MAGPAMGAPGRPGAGGAVGGPGAGASRPSMRKALEVFRYRHYRFLWASSTFSFTGMQMQQVARALLAWQLTESFAASGAIALSFGLPMLLFALVGGSLADRMEKRNLTLMTQASTGILALITAIMVATDTITFELLFVIGLVQGTFFAFGMPARMPLMAEVVGPSNVMSAIAMSNAAMNFTRLFGPAIAAVLVAVSGIAAAYFVMASLYVFSTALLLMVPTGLSQLARQQREAAEGATGAPSGPLGGRPKGSMWREIGGGLRYVWTTPRLRLLIGMMFIITLFAMPYTILLPGYVQEDLGRSEASYGWLQSISGVGALVASLAVATLTDFNRKPLVQWTAGIVSGIGMALLAWPLGMGYAGVILAVIVLGAATTAYQTLNNTMVMGESDPEYYGRVMSINMLTFSVMPLMSAPLGVLADLITAEATFAIMGGVIVVIMTLIGLSNRDYTFQVEAPREYEPSPRLPAAASASSEDSPAAEAPAPQPMGVGGGGGGGGA
ncbi:MAG: MFS transporter [Dehalococcoidia bacterium]|nr:MFS transporter [Dehalococcoidia bacterium]